MFIVPKTFRVLLLLGVTYIVLGVAFLVAAVTFGTEIPVTTMDATWIALGSVGIGVVLLAVRRNGAATETHAQASTAHSRMVKAQTDELSTLVKSLRADVKGSVDANMTESIDGLEERLVKRLDAPRGHENHGVVQASAREFSFGRVTLLIRPRN